MGMCGALRCGCCGRAVDSAIQKTSLRAKLDVVEFGGSPLSQLNVTIFTFDRSSARADEVNAPLRSSFPYRTRVPSVIRREVEVRLCPIAWSEDETSKVQCSHRLRARDRSRGSTTNVRTLWLTLSLALTAFFMAAGAGAQDGLKRFETDIK